MTYRPEEFYDKYTGQDVKIIDMDLGKIVLKAGGEIITIEPSYEGPYDRDLCLEYEVKKEK